MLKFNEENHTYELDGRVLTSVTQLMKKHGLSANYDGIPAEILKASAERGTLIHKEIETFIKSQEIGFTAEVIVFKDYIEKNGITVLESEFMANNDIIAGTIDLILNDGEKTVIADIKTTSQIYTESVSWQLSIYAYLTDYNIDKGQCWHFTKDGQLEVIEIPLKPKTEVERLIECERAGTLYSAPTVVDSALLERLYNIESLIKQFDENKKSAEKQAQMLRQSIITAMENNAVKSLENDRIRLTYIAPGTRTSIDTTRLKAEKPEIYTEYQKTSETSASLRITIKDDNRN